MEFLTTFAVMKTQNKKNIVKAIKLIREKIKKAHILNFILTSQNIFDTYPGKLYACSNKNLTKFCSDSRIFNRNDEPDLLLHNISSDSVRVDDFTKIVNESSQTTQISQLSVLTSAARLRQDGLGLQVSSF